MEDLLFDLNKEKGDGGFLELRNSLIEALEKCEEVPITRSSSLSLRTSPVISSRSSSPASTVVRSPLVCSIATICQLKDCDSHCFANNFLSKPLPNKHKRSACQKSSQQPSSSQSPSSASSSSSASNNKSVRFNSSVKVTSLPNKTACNNKQSKKEKNKEKVAKNDNCASKCISINNDSISNYISINKSILKDPLCDSLRNAVHRGEFDYSSECSLESEIDSLLYGSEVSYSSRESSLSQTTDFEDDEDFPANYVTMIEHKYRTFGGTAAGTRSIRSRKATPEMPRILDYKLSNKSCNHYKYLFPSGDSRISDSAALPKQIGSKSLDAVLTDISRQSDASDTSSASYRNLPEQHIYEEILYDSLDSKHK